MADPIPSVDEYTGSVPIRKQRANFSGNTADALAFTLASLPVKWNASIAAINNLIPEIMAAAQAASLVNFLGRWEDLTSSLPGPPTDPASCYHSGQIWTQLDPIADPTVEEPGISTKWGLLDARRGVETVSSAVDITLTPSSKTVQRITMTAAEKMVSLPDATALVPGEYFDVYNEGTHRFGMPDYDGAFVCSIDGLGFARITLVDNSTASGTWKASDGSDLLLVRLQTVINDGASSYLTGTKFEPTTVLISWAETGHAYAQVLTWVPGTPEITKSNKLEIYVGPASHLSSCTMTPTVGIIAYTDADSDGKICAVTYTSGTNTLALTDTHEFKDAATIADKILAPIYPHATTGRIGLMYRDTVASGGTYIHAQILSWNGATIEPHVAEQASADQNYACQNFSADVVDGTVDAGTMFLSYSLGGASQIKVYKITYGSGTTITFVAPVVVASTYVTESSLVVLDSDYFVIAYIHKIPTTNTPHQLKITLYSSALAVKKEIELGSNVSTQSLDIRSLSLYDSDTLLLAADPIRQGNTVIYKIKAVGATSGRNVVLKVVSVIDIGYISSSYKNLISLNNGAVFTHVGASSFVTAERVEVG